MIQNQQMEAQQSQRDPSLATRTDADHGFVPT